MAVTHKNRKGNLYYLHAGITKTGKPRYWFSRKPDGELVNAVPPGFEIFEDVNGIVSLRKPSLVLIEETEVRMVRAALDEHPHLLDYRVEAKANTIIIYRAYNPLDDAFLAELAGLTGGIRMNRPRIREMQLRTMQYDPVLKFTLTDRRERTFSVARMFYSGEGGWLPLFGSGALDELARSYVPHLGQDSYYEMF